jgi:hypothetical protein
MTDTPMKLVVDCTTGEQEYIPLTQEEISEQQAELARWLQSEAEREALELAQAEAKASAEAKLAALGLTPEEISALKA